MNPIYEQMATSVFERMSTLAQKYDAVNLGQGFPDFGWPDEVLDAAASALKEGSNQYAPSRGLPALREAVAAHYRRHQGLDISGGQVCVTSGATEALGAAILATVEPGDEVILLTPAYDCYAPMVRRASGAGSCGWAKDSRDPVQQSAQPGSASIRTCGAGGGRVGRAPARPDRDQR